MALGWCVVVIGPVLGVAGMRRVMMSVVVVVFAAVLGVVCVGGQDGTLPGERTSPGYMKEVEALEAKREELSARLVKVAGDAGTPADDRREAIMALGRLGTAEGDAFLAENISLKMPYNGVAFEENFWLSRPCVMSLCQRIGKRKEGDWNRARAVLEAAGGKFDREDVAAFAEVLRKNVGPWFAPVLVREHLRSQIKPEQYGRENFVMLLEKVERNAEGATTTPAATNAARMR